MSDLNTQHVEGTGVRTLGASDIATAHDPHLAHHFASPEQQRASGKLGMWVFLATEILMFGGLFCAYAVYRANHPEIFIYAHKFLNKTLGGINTVVLICSSLTMAWGVRCAQLNRQRGLAVCLVLTLLGACGFLGIKYVEYKAKWEHGLLWASEYHPTHSGEAAKPQAAEPAKPTSAELAKPQAENSPVNPDAPRIKPAPVGPPGMLLSPSHHVHATAEEPRNAGIFFSVYFLMTGLHGIHVLVGMGLIAWILRRSLRHEFNESYFAPVDLVGLYWHLVDLIWIFLFPLLYLIH